MATKLDLDRALSTTSYGYGAIEFCKMIIRMDKAKRLLNPGGGGMVILKCGLDARDPITLNCIAYRLETGDYVFGRDMRYISNGQVYWGSGTYMLSRQEQDELYRKNTIKTIRSM